MGMNCPMGFYRGLDVLFKRQIAPKLYGDLRKLQSVRRAYVAKLYILHQCTTTITCGSKSNNIGFM